MIALQYYRKKSGLTQEQLANKIRASRSALAMWEIGATEPDIETVKKICRVLKVPEKDLMIKVAEWRGDIEEDYRHARDDAERLDIFEKAGVPVDMIPKYIDIRDKNNPNIPVSTGTWIPVLGKVAAGIPLEAIENVVDYEEIPDTMARAGEHVALQIHGDSMEPKFSDGDVVIVRIQPEVENGDIAIVFVNGDDATCKKIKKTPEGVMLISLNPAYEPMFYSRREVELLPVRIFGKVVELRAKF